MSIIYLMMFFKVEERESIKMKGINRDIKIRITI